MGNSRNLQAVYRRVITAKGGRIPFIANMLIGCSIALFVYFLEQTGLIEHALNRVLYLLLASIGMVFRYREFHLFSITGILFDIATIAVSATFWTVLRSASARILANLILFVALTPITMIMFDTYGILISGIPIILGIIVAITLDAAFETVRKLMRRRIAEEKQEAEYSIIRHLAHNVKPGLQIARSPLVAIQKFLDNRELLNQEISRRLDGSSETVGEALSNAIASLSQINDII